MLKLIGRWRPFEEENFDLIRVGKVIEANYGFDRFDISLTDTEVIKRPDYSNTEALTGLNCVSGIGRVYIEKHDIVCILSQCRGTVFHEYIDKRLHKLKKTEGKNGVESVANYQINY